MKTTHSPETLKTALAALETLDAVDLVGEFRAFKHDASPGTYCALVLDPSDGTTTIVNEASWSCSADEYFSESGILSRATLISSTRAHWSPSPEDGFEWCDGSDYVHPEEDYSAWITAEAFAELEEEERAKFTKWFSISDTPVEGWVPDGSCDHDVREVEKQLEALRSAICTEIENLEADES
jgi:hypothetical protein